MKYIALAALLALALGYAQAVPLQGGNGNATAVLFDAVRAPLASNETGTIGLELDLSFIPPEEAKFQLVDSKDAVYEPTLYGNLQNGRQLLIFKVPEYALFKQFKVVPTSGEPFNVNWWDTPKSIKDDKTLRYYGVVDWRVTPGFYQGIVYQISLFNSTSPIPVTLDNFTLLDQWGWPYTPTDIETLPNGRINLIFGDIVSPLSSPTSLVYDYTEPGEILINLENDLQPLSDEKVYGANATRPATPPQPAEVRQPPADIVSQNQSAQRLGNLKEDIAASKSRLRNVTAETITGPSSSGNMKTGIELAEERLEMMKKHK